MTDERDAAATAASAIASDHIKEASALRSEIAELRLSLAAASNAESIVASLTDENTTLADAIRALKIRVAELEELVEMSRMYVLCAWFAVSCLLNTPSGLKTPCKIEKLTFDVMSQYCRRVDSALCSVITSRCLVAIFWKRAVRRFAH